MKVQSTARTDMHLQFDITALISKALAFEIKAVQSSQCL
jgi:hypothetical protein